ncbi:hypothetical protein ABFX02_14G317100 [Erythranthe guttata]
MALECRKFEITIISAENLEDVRLIGKMEVHARVSIGGSPEKEKRTPTDTHGKRNPAWNYTMDYTIMASVLDNYNSMLVVKLYCSRNLGDRYVGEVHVSMKRLFDDVAGGGRSGREVTIPVTRGSVRSQGALTFSYSFG